MNHAANEYWGREDLLEAVLGALLASGKNLDQLSTDDLAPLDQFHSGGKGTTTQLAHLAGLRTGMRVLDVGGGLGGPARTLAREFGCHVTVLEPVESYLRAGRALTERLGLGEQVKHEFGDALELPFAESTFDAVWTQNAGMNITDKEQLYAGFHKVLRGGGILAFQEPMAGPIQPLVFPVMWAADQAGSFLRPPAEMRVVIEAAGFASRQWRDVTKEIPARRGAVPRESIPFLIKGDGMDAITLSGQRNESEGRLVHVQAVFEKLSLGLDARPISE